MTIEIPVLDDRSFDQLVAEARARVAVHTPEWTNLNDSDPGITILELFAFLTDNLLYRSNRIPEANRLKFLSMLGVTLQPASPGVGLITISNDRNPSLAPQPVVAGADLQAGQVHFAIDSALSVLPVTATVFFKQPQQLSAAALAQNQLLYQTFLAQQTDVLQFYKPAILEAPATGKPDPVVDLGDAVNGTIDRSLWIALQARKGASVTQVRQAIGGQTLSIGVFPTATVPGQVLLPASTGTGSAGTDPGLIVEIAAPTPSPADPLDTQGTGLGVGDANYARLPISYAENILDAPGLIQVTLPRYEQLLLWAFDPEEEGTGDFPPRVDDPKISAQLITWIRLRYPQLSSDTTNSSDITNSSGTGMSTSTAASPTSGDCGCDSTVIPTDSAVPGRITWVGVNATRAVQAIYAGQGYLGLAPGTPYHVVTLAHTPVLTTAVPSAGSDALTVEVQAIDGTWEKWQRIDDLYAAGREDTVYLLDPAAGTITFGSGINGLRPVRGARIRASYWYGGGAQGRIPIGGINKLNTTVNGLTATNPLPTWGAGDGETVSDGESAITSWLRHRDRLVTEDDFRDLTRRTPGIDLGRVEVLPLFNPDDPSGASWPGVVTLLVIPRADPASPSAPVPDRQFLDAVCGWLAPRRLVTTEVQVRGPVYVRVWATIGVVPLPGQVPSILFQQVMDAVEAFLSPVSGGLPQPGQDTGTGWPLGVNLRAQDIEAVATRVPGVRYVDSVRLAVADAAGNISEVTTVTLTGLQLPDAVVTATAAPAADPVALVGGSQAIAPTFVPVPAVPTST